MKVLLVALVCVAIASAELFNITVKGIAVCKKRPTNDVKITLKEKDTFSDDFLNETKPVNKGEFVIYGEQDEMFSIHPYLTIQHTCDVSKSGCTRTSTYDVPKTFLGGVYDMTYVILENRFDNDVEDCP